MKTSPVIVVCGIIRKGVLVSQYVAPLKQPVMGK